MSTSTRTLINDAASIAPATARRLHQFEREATPIVYGARGAPPRVRLQLPDNGGAREGSGPGIYPTGRVTLIVHRAGCPWPRLPCAGGADCDRVLVASELSDADLRERIEDLEYHLRVGDALPVRIAELEAMRVELAAREPAESADA